MVTACISKNVSTESAEIHGNRRNLPDSFASSKSWKIFFERKSPYFPQHCLYFLPLPQGQGSLRPTLGPVRIGFAFAAAAGALRGRFNKNLPFVGV
jgi:hypothetical protein